MTAYSFFGCAFTAFGPPLALFIITIAGDPVRIIVLILSAFFWLLSLLVSSLLWFAVVPLRSHLAFGLVFSVFFQESSRILLYFLLRRADRVMRKLTENEHTRIFQNKHILSYVVGLGFGMMSGAFSLVNVLADSVGPGTVGLHGESQNFFMVSAALCLSMILSHTCWGVITFSAMDEKKYLWVLYVWAAHMLVSCLTLVNQVDLQALSVTVAYLVLLVSATIAFFKAGGSIGGLKSCLTLSPRTPTTVVQVEE